MAVKTKALSQDLTARVLVGGAAAQARFSAAEGVLRWRVEGGGGGERSLAVESEVLGFETYGAKVTVRAFVGALKGASCGKRVRRDFVFEMPSEESAMAWSERLGDCINSLCRPKRLFILVNPFGGKKCARKIFHREVKPLLEAADVLYTVQETKYQLHAQEIAHSLDLLKYEGIICVSGDGVLVEVVNGLLRREDWHNAIKVPLGIIPAGTGNGMAKSLADAVGDGYSVPNTAFAVIRGHKRSLDVVTVLQGERKFFSVLMLTWGLVADVDIESEKYRWMGSARLDFYCLLRVINLRKYAGHVQFLPAPGYEVHGEPIKQDGNCKGYIGMPKEGHKVPTEGGQSGYQGPGQSGYQGPVASLEDLDWRSLDGPFIFVWVNNVPWSAEDIMPAPKAKFSDGYLDVVIVRDCPKPALASLLLKMSDGSHVKSRHVMYLKVKAFRLKPGQRVGNPTKGGIIDSDGEVIARGEGTYESHQQQGDLMVYGPPIEMTVDQGLATIFSPR